MKKTITTLMLLAFIPACDAKDEKTEAPVDEKAEDAKGTGTGGEEVKADEKAEEAPAEEKKEEAKAEEKAQ